MASPNLLLPIRPSTPYRVVLAVHVAAGRIGIPGSEKLSIHTHG
jgi:hypothetical protein